MKPLITVGADVVMRLLRNLEMLAGALLLFMSGLTSASAFGRYLLSAPIPDEYEISRLLLGVVVCMGIASAFHQDEHIQLDVFWGSVPDAIKFWISGFGVLLCTVATSVFSWALATKVLDSYESGLRTVDLGLPIWPFHALAWLSSLIVVIVLVAKWIGHVRVIRQQKMRARR